jgi:predicted membrane-bound dolichyl-phosphate-mannose-protein mannosyltransferase
MGEDKCAYRYRVEEYYKRDEIVPDVLRKCEYCNGYPKEEGCMQYTNLEHLLDFSRLFQEVDSYNRNQE